MGVIFLDLWQFLTVLHHFLTNLDLFWRAWTSLGQIDPLWTNAYPFWPIYTLFEPIWSPSFCVKLDQIGPLWPKFLDHWTLFGPIWSLFFFFSFPVLQAGCSTLWAMVTKIPIFSFRKFLFVDYSSAGPGLSCPRLLPGPIFTTENSYKIGLNLGTCLITDLFTNPHIILYSTFPPVVKIFTSLEVFGIFKLFTGLGGSEFS